MKKEDFFIGWTSKVPASSRRAIRYLLITSLFFLLAIAFLITFKSKGFNDHTFELGIVREFQGVYYDSPYPMIVLDTGYSPLKNVNEALLVGYGKNGARTFIESAQRASDSLNARHVTIKGTLIYGDGKVLIELTDKDASIIEIGEARKEAQATQLGLVALDGEILDPKCWFGVMKPAEGKVHKSCAIRCISGGIPPVFRSEKDGINSYYVILGLNGQSINQEILPYIGVDVRLAGQVTYRNGWNYLMIDTDKIKIIN